MSTAGVYLSNSMLFCSGFSLGTISSCWSRGLSGKHGSLWITPMASQSRRESAGGDEGLVISVSKGRCFWNPRFERSFSGWVTSTGVPAVLHVSGTVNEAAKRILNSLSNDSTTGPLRTVISCRCRWASVHVRLQSIKTVCYVTPKCAVYTWKQINWHSCSPVAAMNRCLQIHQKELVFHFPDHHSSRPGAEGFPSKNTDPHVLPDHKIKLKLKIELL